MRNSQSKLGVNHTQLYSLFSFVTCLIFFSLFSPLKATETADTFIYELVECKTQDQACITAKENYINALKDYRDAYERYLNVKLRVFGTYVESSVNKTTTIQNKIQEFKSQFKKKESMVSHDWYTKLATAVTALKGFESKSQKFIDNLDTAITARQKFINSNLNSKPLPDRQKELKDYWNAVERVRKNVEDFETVDAEPDPAKYIDKDIQEKIKAITDQMAKMNTFISALDNFVQFYKDNATVAVDILKIRAQLNESELQKTENQCLKEYENKQEELTKKIDTAEKAGAIKLVLTKKGADQDKGDKTPEKKIKIIKAQYGHSKNNARNCNVTGLVKRNCEKAWAVDKFCLKTVEKNGKKVFEIVSDASCTDGDEQLETESVQREMCSIPVQLKTMCGDHYNPAPNSRDRKLMVNFQCGTTKYYDTGRDGKELILYCPYDKDKIIEDTAVKQLSKHGYKP